MLTIANSYCANTVLRVQCFIFTVKAWTGF